MRKLGRKNKRRPLGDKSHLGGGKRRLTRLEHVALSVADLERSLAFYRDVIGLELIRIIGCPPETGLGEVAGMPGCSVRIAHLQSGTVMLELFEYQDPRGEPLSADRKQADHGLTRDIVKGNRILILSRVFS